VKRRDARGESTPRSGDLQPMVYPRGSGSRDRASRDLRAKELSRPLDRSGSLCQASARTRVSRANYNFIERAGTVRARVDLNLRSGAPTTLAPVVNTVSKDSVLEYVGWTSNG